MVADPRRFRMNSNYPSDRVIFLKSGTANVTKSGISIAHSLGFLPLLDGIWRKTSDSIWYSFGTGPVWMYSPATGVSYPMSDAIELSSDGTNMIMNIEAPDNPASSIAIEYRVFGFVADESSDISANPTAIAGQSSRILTSSNQNARKLLQSGTADVAAGETARIGHDLGFLPQTEVWIAGTATSAVRKFIDIASHEPTMAQYDRYQVFVDESALTFVNQDSASNRFYYRIYADEIGATV